MNVAIRPLQASDALVSVTWRNCPAIWTHTGSRPDMEITVDDELAWIRAVIAEESSERFAILVDRVYVGNIYLTGIKDGSAEYHIFIGDQAYWGKGVARLASKEIIRYAVNVLRLRSVTLEVHEDNLAAVSLYRSLGFVQTGRDGAFLHMRLEFGSRSGGEERG